MKKYDFAILVVILSLMNIWFLEKSYIANWDTIERFEMFYFYYNNFFWHGTLAQWLPYYSFGIPANAWQLYILTPMSYFLMVIGKIFVISDTNMLFKLSLLGDQIIFLLGMYLLSSKLFKDRLTVFMVCLASMASSYWYDQIDYSFLMYYMFPLAVYYLIRFLDERKPEFLWLSGLILLAWAMGTTSYFIFVWVPLLLFLLLFLSFKSPNVFGCLLQKSFKNIFLFFLVLILYFASVYQLKTFGNFVNVLHRPPGIKTDLDMFLTYGLLMSNLKEYFGAFVYGKNADIYIGLLPVMAVIWAILRIRKRLFVGFLLCTAGVLWISFGGWGAACLYFFPGVPYYRHIGMLYGLFKVLLVLCAGFGLDYFWDLKIKDQIGLMAIALAFFIFCSDGFGLSQPWLMDNFVHHHSSGVYWGHEPWNSSFYRLGAYFMALGVMLLAQFLPREELKKTGVKGLLFLVLCFDIFSFQYGNYRFNVGNRLLSKELLYILNVHRDNYQQQRSLPMDQRQKDILGALHSAYTTKYSMMQFEPCQSQFRMDFQPKATKLLEDTRQSQYQDLQQVLGCDAPKLRLVDSGVSLDKTQLATMPNLYQPCPHCPEIQVKKFSADELVAQVNAPSKGAWLVYADSFHPGWHAIVNGRPQPVYQAYLAFKAVYLKGPCTVRLYFKDGINYYFSYLMMAFGIICVLFFIGLFFKVLIDPFNI